MTRSIFKNTTIAIAAACGFLLANPSNASAGEIEEAASYTHSGDDHHGFHHHHFGIFTGYAAKDTRKRKDGFKTGLEYEYQFIEWLGVRGFVDYEAGDLKKWLYGGGASVHVPDTPLVLFVGGGIERNGSKNEEFLRLSGEYQIHITEDWYLAPGGGYDFSREGSGAWFAGIMWGTSF